MTSRFIPNKPIKNAGIRRPVSKRAFVWFMVFSIVGILICWGFVISAEQHFEAVTLGFKGEKLRRKESSLEEKQQRLELEYKRITSPIEMERRALKLGLIRPQSQSTNIRRPIN